MTLKHKKHAYSVLTTNSACQWFYPVNLEANDMRTNAYRVPNVTLPLSSSQSNTSHSSTQAVSSRSWQLDTAVTD